MVQVGEPNVPDTIQILRGLKLKYEDHHGVHITDRALVVAAELSDRCAGGGGIGVFWGGEGGRGHAVIVIIAVFSCVFAATVAPQPPPPVTPPPTTQHTTPPNHHHITPRYITARFLPDKAIDLVDEACSTVRVQLDSKPESIDSLERQGVRLRVEREALKKEKDPLSAARLNEVEKELAALEDELKPLLVRGWCVRGCVCVCMCVVALVLRFCWCGLAAAFGYS